jgi:hypothetical protein
MDDREKRQRPSPLVPLITQWTKPSSTLLVFNDLSLKVQPGFHALIAGVRAYSHLDEWQVMRLLRRRTALLRRTLPFSLRLCGKNGGESSGSNHPVASLPAPLP